MLQDLNTENKSSIEFGPKEEAEFAEITEDLEKLDMKMKLIKNEMEKNKLAKNAKLNKKLRRKRSKLQ